MTCVVMYSEVWPQAYPLQTALSAAVDLPLVLLEDVQDLLSNVVRHAPKLVVLQLKQPDDALFRVLDDVAQRAPVPVVLLTPCTDATVMAHAIGAGVQLYARHLGEVHDMGAWLAWTQLRHQHEQALRLQVQDLSQKLEDRKAVERAKGILMQARHLSDEDAFGILRTVSMHANQRLGQVSQQIIHSAHLAESVNRSGQLRMLSQRMVKLYVLLLAGLNDPQYRQILTDTVQRTEGHLEWLGKKMAGDSTDATLQRLMALWVELKHLLQQTPDASRLTALDAQAERFLHEAEALTTGLESLGHVGPLHVLNIAGRQRMLSQRFAKFALLGLMGGEGASPERQLNMEETRQAFEQSLAHLNHIPLSTPPIREGLDVAALCWRQMLHSAARRSGGGNLRDRLERLATASETLLGVFDDLSGQYEHSLDMLIG